ncbi:MAG TPA: hypothetical protein ENK32_03130 [Anaerolineae bacterium]|nr:hypothetical protein [Anaerolineae bacterium]
MESLLSQENSLDVTGISPADEQELIDQIWRLRPQVVVMNSSLLFTNPASLLNRLDMYPHLKIIVINETNNLVQTYEKQSFLAEEHIGLAAIVRGNDLELAYKTAVHLDPAQS